ncbi:MAG: hypothetical protein K8T89_14375 [Planctomycetes bacterium]|nr:hypothetical protein [Planctomycetota bacterium]
MADEYYDDIRNQIQNAMKTTRDTEGVLWAVLDGIAAIIDGATGKAIAGPISSGLQGLRGSIIAKGGKKGISTTPNPWFIFNGHDEGETKATKKYLKGRTLVGIAGAAVAVTGAGLSSVTAVDVGGILQHGNASGSTIAHLVKLKAIASAYKQSQTITSWLNVIFQMKALKLGVRGTQLVGACIPIPAAGAVTGVLGACVKIGVKLGMTKICLATAADLHWRAYQERVISRRAGGMGPASKIIYELFTRRGATRIFGKHDVDAFIQEPCGWMAVSDKLLLI